MTTTPQHRDSAIAKIRSERDREKAEEIRVRETDRLGPEIANHNLRGEQVITDLSEFLLQIPEGFWKTIPAAQARLERKLEREAMKLVAHFQGGHIINQKVVDLLDQANERIRQLEANSIL
tara:strand:+ start:809 stop:1171 length:363 start_codon:yes stop_codon:yes gene_type:complete